MLTLATLFISKWSRSYLGYQPNGVIIMSWEIIRFNLFQIGCIYLHIGLQLYENSQHPGSSLIQSIVRLFNFIKFVSAEFYITMVLIQICHYEEFEYLFKWPWTICISSFTKCPFMFHASSSFFFLLSYLSFWWFGAFLHIF